MSEIIKRIGVLFLVISIYGCKSADIISQHEFQLKFLSEYILPADIMVDKTLVGGLSGIDYYKGIYYLVCDDSSNPRFYEATIELNKTSISNITFEKVIKIQDSSHYFDLESIRFNEKTSQILITSEGHINSGNDTFFFSSDLSGKIENYFNLPSSFYLNSENGPRNNGTLEGLSKSVDGLGYWIAMELPLETDGPSPQLTKTISEFK